MKTANNTFGVIFYLKKYKVNQNGKTPIYARITVNGARIDIATKRSVEEENWNAPKGQAKGNRQDITRLNSFLEIFRAGIVDCYHELLLQKKFITAELLKECFIGADQSEFTLCKLMDHHNQDQAELLETGTMKNYFTTQKYIKDFLKEKHKTSDKYLSELSYRFITDFELYLRKLKDNSGESALGNNGVMKHIERFRKMINLAIRLEWIDKNPFIAYKLKFEKVERQFLTKEELQRIENKELKIGRLELVRDLFVFSCYTGLAYIDTVNLKPSHIVTGMDGEYWMVTSRQKNSNSVKMPILPKAYAVIEKYKDHPKSGANGALLPSFSNQKLNSYLKEIADLCEITKPLTFHIARHTFATTVTLSNGVPIESVSKMLGHTKLTTTQIYAKVVDRKLSDDMAKLRERLK
ncbi:site-specific integrase [Hufsiella ginkgonis]|uniref:Tyrosine-type recombinase/integrase n=1 Tax=Hufsiella ginkgonis TaxID=2695274 RepID=A0A7K1XTS5_9SPHI|nr:site-specific integrase [Hufsiella ginkgonis]MXV14350.1 tyrosine-type recombinase/integrase [Hufsiella ginkgonis]